MNSFLSFNNIVKPENDSIVEWTYTAQGLICAAVVFFVCFFFRLNEAPVKGFEKDVGSKTTMRITYPEGAIQKTERYEAQSLFVLSAFKALDLKWLRHMVFKQRLVRLLA